MAAAQQKFAEPKLENAEAEAQANARARGQMLRLGEVAERLKVSTKTVTRWEDTIPTFPKRIRVGRVSRWRESDVVRFIQEFGR